MIRRHTPQGESVAVHCALKYRANDASLPRLISAKMLEPGFRADHTTTMLNHQPCFTPRRASGGDMSIGVRCPFPQRAAQAAPFFFPAPFCRWKPLFCRRRLPPAKRFARYKRRRSSAHQHHALSPHRRVVHRSERSTRLQQKRFERQHRR